MKLLFKLIAALVLLIAIVVGSGFFYLDSIAKKAIEEGGEMALGVPTSVEGIHISLLGGEASLSGLTIANAPGFSDSTFMGLGNGGVAVSVASLLNDTIVIPHVVLSDIHVNLEQQGKSNNIEPLLANTKKMAGSGQSSSSTAAPAIDSDASGKKFIVEYFALKNIQVNANLQLLGQSSKVNLVLPEIELKNLGTAENGLPMDQLIQKVVEAVLAAAQSSSAQFSPELAKLLKGELGDLKNIKGQVIGKAQAEVDKVVKNVKQNIKDKVKVDLPPEAEKLIDDKADKLIKGLDGLLGGKK